MCSRRAYQRAGLQDWPGVKRVCMAPQVFWGARFWDGRREVQLGAHTI